MKAKTPDQVAGSYSKNPPKLKVKTFSFEEEGHAGSYVLIEGNSRALKMLGEMLIATAGQKSGFDFSFHPQNGGIIFFDESSTHGIYLNLVDSRKTR